MRKLRPIWALLLLSMSLPGTLQAEDVPSLARLSFWLAPERMAEFEGAYAEKVEPFLIERGLVPSSTSSRATVDSVFSRLFEFEDLAALNMAVQAELEPKLRALLQEFGTAFGTPRVDGLIPYNFFPPTTCLPVPATPCAEVQDRVIGASTTKLMRPFNWSPCCRISRVICGLQPGRAGPITTMGRAGPTSLPRTALQAIYLPQLSRIEKATSG